MRDTDRRTEGTRMKRCALAVLVFWLLAGTGLAETGWAYPLDTEALHGGPVLAEITLQAEVLPPLGEQRT